MIRSLRCLLLVACVALLLPFQGFGQGTWRPGEVLVRLENGARFSDVQRALLAKVPATAELKEARPLGKSTVYHKISLQGSGLSDKALEQLVAQLPGVEATTLNYLVEYLATPNDALYGQQWGLADANVDDVWDLTTGGTMANGKRIGVALSDNAIETDHEDLQGNIWPNSPAQGGGSEHGTMVASVLGAVGNNGIGLAGVNWDVEIFSSGETTDLSDVGEQFLMATLVREQFNASNGMAGLMVVSITASWGSTNAGTCNGFFVPLFTDMTAAGIILVGGGPNETFDMDQGTVFPANCALAEHIVVTSYGPQGQVPFATGANSVHLLAPGVAIPVATENNAYLVGDGNSFAIPYVAGAIALLYSVPCYGFAELVMNDPVAARQMVKNAILQNTTPFPGGNAITITGGKLNVFAAYQALMAQCPSCDTVTVSLTTSAGSAAQYNVVNGMGVERAEGTGSSFEFCSEDGCYTGTITDGASQPLDGTFTVELNGSLIHSGSIVAGELDFSVGNVVQGCTDTNASNYSSTANCDDGTCCLQGSTAIALIAADPLATGTAQLHVQSGGSTVFQGPVTIAPVAGGNLSYGLVSLCGVNGCLTVLAEEVDVALSPNGLAFEQPTGNFEEPFPIGVTSTLSVGHGTDEVCDGLDNDCDGLVDEDFTWYLDNDGDSWGALGTGIVSCTPLPGRVLLEGDCDDNNANVTPGLPDDCADADGLDNNCDGQIDEGGLLEWYPDVDNDQTGAITTPIVSCTQPLGHVSNTGDCDDTNANISPNAVEICDGIDNNCNGTIDEGFTWYTDADGDGYGDDATALNTCNPPQGAVAIGGDCDDSDPTLIGTVSLYIVSDLDAIGGSAHYVFTQGALVVEGDVTITEDVEFPESSLGLVTACLGNGCFTIEVTQNDVPLFDEAYVQLSSSPNSFNAFSISTGYFGSNGIPATELCDGLDNDCDGEVDEDFRWYADVDADGFGDDATMQVSCTSVPGAVQVGGDCDDADANLTTIGATCDDGNPATNNDIVRDNCSCLGFLQGECPAGEVADCNGNCAPEDWLGDGFCDDGAFEHHGVAIFFNCAEFNNDEGDCGEPCTAEVCDGVDNDCDGQVDEGVTLYADNDGDVFGDPNAPVPCGTPGAVADNTDCNDNDPLIGAGACANCSAADQLWIAQNQTTIEELMSANIFNCLGSNLQACLVDVLTSETPLAEACATCIAQRYSCILSSCLTSCIGGFEAPNCQACVQANCQQAYLTCTGLVDADGDGSLSTIDCDDNDASVFPGAAEICDSIDNDCDGQVDENVVVTYYLDTDGDGFGNDGSAFTGDCDQLVGTVTIGGDCDDATATTFPGAPDLCNGDGIDNDCDGNIDDDGIFTWYVDADGDGYGDVSDPGTVFCGTIPGSVTLTGDCDDTDAAIHPNAEEVPCDNIDNDCNGDVDDVDAFVWYRDNDGDGYGCCFIEYACTQPPGFAAVDGDCDDANAAVFPGATELCDGTDQACDGGNETWYPDADQDNFGDGNNPVYACTQPPGHIADGNDCDDSDPDRYPGGPIPCPVCGPADLAQILSDAQFLQGLDGACLLDCAGGGNAVPCYAQCIVNNTGISTTCAECIAQRQMCVAQECLVCVLDPGSPACQACMATSSCNADFVLCSGLVDADGDGSFPPFDCNDNAPSVYPGADEVCDGLDNDCDGDVDEDITITYYTDADGDGFGAIDSDMAGDCDQPPGTVTQGGDCDDANAAINPNAEEICDGLDNDCNFAIDDEAGELYFVDNDGDGYGSNSSAEYSCTPLAGRVLVGGDCNDTNASIHPGATDPCDTIDQDCNGGPFISVWYEDADGDGYGNELVTTNDCAQPNGYVDNSSDCDDTDDQVFPGNGCSNCGNTEEAWISTHQVELLNAIVDCSGSCFGSSDPECMASCLQANGVPASAICLSCVDDYIACGQGGACAIFCQQNPEACYGCLVLQGCAATLATCLGQVDADGDGAWAGTDCNDENSAMSPFAQEVCDNTDNDCDGLVDEGFPVTYADNDGDGFGDDSVIMPCDTPGVAIGGDCDDNNPNVFPGAGCVSCTPQDIAWTMGNSQPSFFCTSGCSAPTEEEIIACLVACYVDAGLGTPCATCVVEYQVCVLFECPECADAPNSSECIQCRQSAGCDGAFTDCSGFEDNDADGYFTPEDCDDTNANVHPNAAEGCTVDGLDNDCDGQVDENALVDQDADGFTLCEGDCNDQNDQVNPAATEVCDGIDNDCDGLTDEGFTLYFRDFDGDGYGDPQVPQHCVAVGGVTNDLDCDDSNATVYQGAPEFCDGIDNDCDGQVDEQTFDMDGDGISECDGDCDDSDPAIYPGAPELCDGLDNDCNGAIEPQLYADLDGDGYGSVDPVACGQAGAPNTQDCDDNDPLVTLPQGWFVDADGDGYGSSGPAFGACTQPAGYADNSYDCDDTNANIFPGQGCLECLPADLSMLASDPYIVVPTQGCLMSCGGASDPQQCIAGCYVDNGLSPTCADCFAAYQFCLVAQCPVCQEDPESAACIQCRANSNCAEGFGVCSGLEDADGDGYFAPYDCDDANTAVHPDAPELCDGLDNDCDGGTDEGVASLWYYDMDADGFGIPETTMVACTQPLGFAALGGDCNDQNAQVYPGAIEVCDGIDNDCNGVSDEVFTDSDFDGTSDCVDGCPFDPLKTSEGLCGCGLVDVDDNNNGICDSEETFPFVKLGIVGTANEELEVRLLPNATYTGMLTATVITVRWPTTPGVSITGNAAAYVSPTIINAAGGILYEGTTTNGGFSYATFSTLAPFVPLGAADAFTAGVEKPFFRVPYVNTTNTCVQFQVLDNAFQDNENLQWFISLSGYERNNGYIAGKTMAIAHPPLTCNNVQRSLSASGTASLLLADLHNGVPVSCGAVLVSASQTSFACADVGVVPVTLTLAFTDGSTNTCVSQVTVVDDLAPVITSGTIAACYSDLGALEFDVLAATSATDNCAGVITYSTSLPGPCATDVTVTATDAHGNSSSVTYSTRVDGNAPVVSNAPGSLDATLECPDATGLAAALALEPSATDDCTVPPSVLLTADNTAGSGCAYVRTRTWTFTDLCGNESTFTQTITVISVVNVTMRVFLEGPYVQATERMNDDLRFDGLLPLTQPYTIAPFNYAGNETAAPGLFASSDPDNAIVDWVLLELRDPATPTIIVARRAALVQRDGDVVDVDGTSSVTFSNLAAGSYHVAVRQRNHLGAMTALPLGLSATSTSIDFTTSALQTYGSEACKTIGTRRALWSGNALHDKRLRYTGAGNDRDVILVRIGGTVPTNVVFNVYALEDVNLDGDVKYTGAFNDRDYILVNIGGTVPTAQRFEQLP